MTTVYANGVTLGIESFGDDGAPLVLLVGATTMLAWPNALCERLAAGGRRVVHYDRRDSGESTTADPEAPTYTLRDLAADAAALADTLGGGPAHLAGIGVGGMVAQVAALDHPRAFSALTLTGTRAVAPGPRGAGGSWRSNVYSVPANGLPDGGMITTADDLTRLADAIRNRSLLSPASTTAMLTVHGTDPANPNEHYGYGMCLSVSDGRLVRFGHGGADPGINASFRHYIDRNATLVVLANVDEDGAELAAADVADLIESCFGLNA